MKIIVPMAGLGTRFQKVADTNPEYKKPKPFISVKGSPMIRWATASLPFAMSADELIFIILKEHDEKHGIEKGLKDIYSDKIRVIKLPGVTRGAAETAYHAKPFVDPGEEIIITDSDHHFDGAELARVIQGRDDKTAGIIPVFKARNEGIPKWSYSLLKEKLAGKKGKKKGAAKIRHIITKVAEKDAELMNMGAHANIGAYYFSKARYFFDEAEEAIRGGKVAGAPGKAEFYIAPLYQNIIEKGMQVEAAILPAVWGLGTPEDLEYFLHHDIELE